MPIKELQWASPNARTRLTRQSFRLTRGESLTLSFVPFDSAPRSLDDADLKLRFAPSEHAGEELELSATVTGSGAFSCDISDSDSGDLAAGTWWWQCWDDAEEEVISYGWMALSENPDLVPVDPSDPTIAYVPTTTTITINGTTQDLTDNRSWTVAASATWGSITGTLAAQTDLQSALDAKAPLASPTFTGTVTIPSGASISGYLTTVAAAAAYQPLDGELTALAGLTSAANKLPYFTGSGTASLTDFTAAARTVLDDATVSAMVDTLGGASATGSGGLVRATGPTIAGAATFTGSVDTTAVSYMIVGSGSKFQLRDNTDPNKAVIFSVANVTTLTTRTWTFPDADGTFASQAYVSANFQPLDADLTVLASITIDANTFPARSSTGAAAAKTITDFGLSLVDDADASAARTTLGLGTLATQSGTFSGTSSGTNTGDQNTFSTIAVSGQSNVVADSATDTLTLAAGSNITITTDASTDTITIAAAGAGVPTTITVADSTSATCYVALFESATGDLAPKTNGGLTYNATTGVLAATGFSGPLTGNVTGNASGSSGSCTGNAATATALATPRAINGVSFDGTAPITVTAAAGTLTGTTLASNVVTSSLTAVGTIATGVWQGTIVGTAYGGTGVDNSTGGTANTFWARPNGATGAATYRAIVAADIPTLNQNTTGSAATLTTSRTLWGQSFDGSANVTGSLSSVADITGGASSMTITAGTGASRTLVFKTTTAGSTATTALTLAADQSATFANTVNATTFVGALTGNASGSSGSCTGNAATATALATARAIYGNNFDGTAALTQVIASTYGGTGNGFAKLSGPTTSEKTFTLPDASAAILTDNAAVTVAQGGTGRATSTTAYGLLAAGTTATGAHQTLAAGATTEILVGGGASALPVWTAATGSGSPVRGTSPTIATPTITGRAALGAADFGAQTDNGNSGTSKTIDWSAKNYQKVTLTGNCTFTFTAPSGTCSLTLELIEDGTGSHTTTWPATVDWTEGAAPGTMTLNKTRLVVFTYNGSRYRGQFTSAF